MMNSVLLTIMSSGIDTGMKHYSNNMRQWWNDADKTFSHIEYNRWLKSPNDIQNVWKRRWLHKFTPTPGRVAEYGIGAGLLGKLLLTEYNATHYTGLDISDRQLHASNETLSQCCLGKYELKRVDYQISIDNLQGIDTFVSQAVIQHFPTKEYTNHFLHTINMARSIAWVMLQVRELRNFQNVPPPQCTTFCNIRTDNYKRRHRKTHEQFSHYMDEHSLLQRLCILYTTTSL